VPGRKSARAGALGPQDFAALIGAFAPFEPHPTLAVAVSGGADSMALAILAADWAKARGGRAVALTVDHGLRSGSAREARQTGRWLGARGIAHRVLTWAGQKPASGIQAAAREARYRLLGDWCRRHGVLHLLVAHTREDQAETFLLRLGRGSGADGLAGMPALVERPQLRLLRPLLAVSKARLVATLKARQQEWIEDPSNRDESFARVRVRAMLSARADKAAMHRRLAAASSTLGRARAANERAAAALLAAAARLHPAGYIELDAARLCAGAPGAAARAVGRCLMAVSGEAYAPRGEKMARLLADVLGDGPFRPRTLGGCRILPSGGRILICREWKRSEPAVLPPGGGPRLWDRRFVVRRRGAQRGAGALRVGALGEKGWAEVVKQAPQLRAAVPAAVRPALPALFDAKQRVLAVPHLGFFASHAKAAHGLKLAWQPANPLTAAGFSVA
jgi:tRNA(Ile)-lysidine synthase